MRLDPMLPAPPMGPRIDFWTPVNKVPESVLMVNSRIYAHYIHYDKRTIPCFLETDCNGAVIQGCEHCMKGVLPRRWKGYLYVYRIANTSFSFLCIPEGLGSNLQHNYGPEFNYRGLLAKVYRYAGQKNKGLILEVNQLAERRTELPEEVDPTPYLEVVFRLKKRLPVN